MVYHESSFLNDVHIAAVSCAERGLRSHLLLRGEQPNILAGYNLISTMYGNVKYMPRSVYANREETLKTHASSVAGADGCVLSLTDILEAPLTEQNISSYHPISTSMKDQRSLGNFSRKVVIVNEGAGDSIALLGNTFVDLDFLFLSACLLGPLMCLSIDTSIQ